MANRYFKQFMSSIHNKPVLVDFSFVVDSTNGNGLGVRSLKGSGLIESVFMATSATPGSVNGVTNPNPAAGYIVVNLQDNYARFLGSWGGFVAPNSGTTATTVTLGQPYVIASLGTATTAQWVAKGFPVGVIPAIGAAFIASATGTIGGAATVVQPVATGSGIDHIEALGDPNQTITSPNSAGGGAIILACYKNTAITAPANGTVIGLEFYFNNSLAGV
jgi:hypothetical protein